MGKNQTPIKVDGDDELLSVPRVAGIFNVSVPRAYAIIAEGKIPSIRMGRAVRVSRSQLERWIDEQSRASIVSARDE